MLQFDIVKNNEFDVAKIANKELRTATARIQKLYEKASGLSWETAKEFAVVKSLVEPETKTAKKEDIKKQFGTLRNYADFLGIDVANIHNGAKAFRFLVDNKLVPTAKDAKGNDKILYNEIPLNMGQAVILSSYTKEQLEAVKKAAEAEGCTLNAYSVKKLRTFKALGVFVEQKEGAHKAIESGKSTAEEPKKEEPKKEEPKKEEPKKEEAKKGVITKDTIPVKISAAQKADAIDAILGIMKHYNLSLNDVAVAYNKKGKA